MKKTIRDIKAFEEISHEDYKRLENELSKAFEIHAKCGSDLTKVREKIEELELMRKVYDYTIYVNSTPIERNSLYETYRNVAVRQQRR